MRTSPTRSSASPPPARRRSPSPHPAADPAGARRRVTFSARPDEVISSGLNDLAADASNAVADEQTGRDARPSILRSGDADAGAASKGSKRAGKNRGNSAKGKSKSKGKKGKKSGKSKGQNSTKGKGKSKGKKGSKGSSDGGKGDDADAKGSAKGARRRRRRRTRGGATLAFTGSEAGALTLSVVQAAAGEV